MNQKEYEQQDLSGKQDLFQEYLDSLPEEKPEIRVSRRVEEDVERFQKEKRFSRPLRNTRRGRNRAGVLLAAGIVIAMTLGISAAMITSYRYDTSYETEVEPEWVGEETEYSFLGQDISVPEFMLDGEQYQLPLSLSDLLDSGWEIGHSGFSSSPEEVGAEPVVIRISRNGSVVEMTVVSPTGETVPLEEATVTGIYVSEDMCYDFMLPYDVSFWQSEWGLEDALDASGAEWHKTSKDNRGEYTLVSGEGDSEYKLVLRTEDDMLKEIMMTVGK